MRSMCVCVCVCMQVCSEQFCVEVQLTNPLGGPLKVELSLVMVSSSPHTPHTPAMSRQGSQGSLPAPSRSSSLQAVGAAAAAAGAAAAEGAVAPAGVYAASSPHWQAVPCAIMLAPKTANARMTLAGRFTQPVRTHAHTDTHTHTHTHTYRVHTVALCVAPRSSPLQKPVQQKRACECVCVCLCVCVCVCVCMCVSPRVRTSSQASESHSQAPHGWSPYTNPGQSTLPAALPPLPTLPSLLRLRQAAEQGWTHQQQVITAVVHLPILRVWV